MWTWRVRRDKVQMEESKQGDKDEKRPRWGGGKKEIV